VNHIYLVLCVIDVVLFVIPYAAIVILCYIGNVTRTVGLRKIKDN
jgi:hypothetical protein